MGTVKKAGEWFENWFDSPYYHILYEHRDDAEAIQLIDNLISHLSLSTNCSILDACCGNGRHALYLADKGYDVTGFDISQRNIQLANRDGGDKARFFVHDMRDPVPDGPYDVVMNLFTSFGYFNREKSLIKTLQNFSDALKPDGYFILDFFNARKTLQELVKQETVVRQGIEFHIRRYREKPFLVKEISFNIDGRDYNYTERVRLLELKDFEHFFDQTGLKIKELCGDYNMNPFDVQHSPRLILIAESCH